MELRSYTITEAPCRTKTLGVMQWKRGREACGGGAVEGGVRSAPGHGPPVSAVTKFCRISAAFLPHFCHNSTLASRRHSPISTALLVLFQRIPPF